MASFLIAVGILPIIVIAVTGLIAFDRLIQYHHRNHRDEWERVGKPWLGALNDPLDAVSVNVAKPPRSKPLRFVPPLTYSWFFRPPEWSRRDKRSEAMAPRLSHLFSAFPWRVVDRCL